MIGCFVVGGVLHPVYADPVLSRLDLVDDLLDGFGEFGIVGRGSFAVPELACAQYMMKILQRWQQEVAGPRRYALKLLLENGMRSQLRVLAKYEKSSPTSSANDSSLYFQTLLSYSN